MVKMSQKVTGGTAIGNTRLFLGREYDSEIGLCSYGGRYYNPTTGRFLQVAESTEKLPDTNPNYGENNPENNAETSGNIPEDSRLKPYKPRKRDTVKIKPSFIDQHNPDGSVIRIFHIGTADEFTITIKGPTESTPPSAKFDPDYWVLRINAPQTPEEYRITMWELFIAALTGPPPNGDQSGSSASLRLRFVIALTNYINNASPENKTKILDALLGFLKPIPNGAEAGASTPAKKLEVPKQSAPVPESGQAPGEKKECPDGKDEHNK